MRRISSVYARTPEIRNGNSTSRIRKTGLSQPVKSPAERILFLQRAIGNRAVQRMIKSGDLQRKLAVNPPGDIYEQEADIVAKQVVNRINMPANQGTPVQHQGLCKEEECAQMKPADILHQDIPKEEEEEKLMEKNMVKRQETGEGWTAAPELENSIQRARGGGQPLSDNIRAPMEQAFGADFSDVRVHTDTHSDMLNHSLQARAFTTGKDIFFKQGEYNPGTSVGQELIAHELTHVVQQSSQLIVQRKLKIEKKFQQQCPSRNDSKLGLGEELKLKGNDDGSNETGETTNAPEYKLDQGNGTLVGDTFTATDAGTVKLSIKRAGESDLLKDTITMDVIVPSNATMHKNGDRDSYFDNRLSSAYKLAGWKDAGSGFWGIPEIKPDTVSWSKLKWREDGGVKAATGDYSSENGLTHTTGATHDIENLTNKMVPNSSQPNGDDVRSMAIPGHPVNKAWQASIADWPIEWQYMLPSEGTWHTFVTVHHHDDQGTDGAVTTSKQGATHTRSAK